MSDELLDFVRRSIAANEEKAQQLLAKKKQEKALKLLSQSGLGRRFQQRTFNNFIAGDRHQDALRQAKNFVADFPNTKGLLFSGPVGVGKTHLAAAIANNLIDQLYVVIFGSSADIISRIKQTYGSGQESELGVIEALTNVDLLVIDDLGKEKASDNTSTVLYQIINRLYEDERPLVITTNYTSDVLAKRLGERGEAIVSRITEMCRPVVMQGGDWRLKREG